MHKVFNFKRVGKTKGTIDGNFIRIKRSGFLNLANHGSKGEKTINISSISSVQLKKPNNLTNGYLQFSFSGGNESTGGIISATQDENTITFAKLKRKL